jgi:hypothetical protein
MSSARIVHTVGECGLAFRPAFNVENDKMALIDYHGHRVIAMSILPISEKTIVYGRCALPLQGCLMSVIATVRMAVAMCTVMTRRWQRTHNAVSVHVIVVTALPRRSATNSI